MLVIDFQGATNICLPPTLNGIEIPCMLMVYTDWCKGVKITGNKELSGSLHIGRIPPGKYSQATWIHEKSIARN